ncbi:MAG TPA: Rho termination factor N-terminal domain-containing protein [Solirubrobacterales bacterium]|nr:Rho termination factor N-terminal domain-containing protein [Solirubrobacterales bacterium]
MTKSDLESKHLAELHQLAAEAGIERYRMLPRAELIERLVGGNGATAVPGANDAPSPGRGERPSPRGEGDRPSPRSEGDRPKRQRRRRKPREGRDGEEAGREEREAPRAEREGRAEERPKPEPRIAPATTPAATTPPPASRPKRKRRRRWGRRGRKGVRVQDLLLPAVAGRQAIVYAESREGCTALLRGLAAELGDASDGADPIALLVDPSPEELADWRREAPQAEIVAAGQARHADDALAQAARRAGEGEDVFVLIDSLSRFAEAYDDGNGAKRLFDAGREAAGSGSLTVVAAVEQAA